MSAANIHNTQRSLEELKKYFRPLAKFIRISPGKPPICNYLIISIIVKSSLPGEAKSMPSREPICPADP